jgi:hypothetical protein
MIDMSPETHVELDTPRGDAEPENDPTCDRIVYPVKRTPGRSIIWDFLDQNLKSEYYRRLLHEGK